MNTSLQNYAYPTESLINNLQSVIYTDRKKTSIIIQDIMMLEGEGNYTYLHLKDGKKILLSKTLKEFCNLLSQKDFARIRKSHLVNLNFLKDVDFSADLSVTMQTGQRIEISRRRKTEFQQQFRSFKQKK